MSALASLTLQQIFLRNNFYLEDDSDPEEIVVSDESLQGQSSLDGFLKSSQSDVKEIQQTEIIIRKSYHTTQGTIL